MKNLVSEQIPNDGSYNIKRLVNEANERLGRVGKYGKRAKIVAKKSSLSLQFSFKDGSGKSQRNPGLGGIPMSPQGVLEAERIAAMVTNQLSANSFTWDWFNNLIGKDTSEQNKQLTCKEMVEQYKKHFFKQRKNNKAPQKSWYDRCRAIQETLGELDKPLSLSLIRQVIESQGNDSSMRKETLQGVAAFLKYFDNSEFKQVIKEYKANNNPKRKKRNIPSDNRITEVYKTGFTPAVRGGNKYKYRCPQWQFLYSLLATYGLRVHEAWNIANWDKPVTLEGNDWVEVDTEDDGYTPVDKDKGKLIYLAILDPNNEHHLLCIKHNTKTGYRVAFPLSPEGHNWIKEFNLLQPLNLPDIPNPLKRIGKSESYFTCSPKTAKWFAGRNYGFTPHDLRHAFNHRAHRLGINPKAVADSLGHSMTMNQSGYLRHMSASVKHEGIIKAITEEQNKRSENELLKEENKALKAQLQASENENELLRTKLKMYEAIGIKSE